MKKRRHNEILSIISGSTVETQDDLAARLREAGYVVTQATVSRDIQELSLTKIKDENGRQKYASIDARHGKTDRASLFSEAVNSVEYAMNLVVIKTRVGMGMAGAVEIDGMELPCLLGTIGSDDVVFCAIKSEAEAKALKSHFLSLTYKS